jgi:hypothetical protein
MQPYIEIGDHMLNMVHGVSGLSSPPNRFDKLIMENFVPATHGLLAGLECYLYIDPKDAQRVYVCIIFQGRGYAFYQPTNH